MKKEGQPVKPLIFCDTVISLAGKYNNWTGIILTRLTKREEKNHEQIWLILC